MRLYEIAEQVEMILARDVDHETGEIGDDAIAALDDLEMERSAKLLALAAYAKGENAEAQAITLEMEKLKKRAQAHVNRGQRLVKYMADNFPKDAAKISDSRSVIKWVKNPDKVEISHGIGVPLGLCRHVPASNPPDKVMIKKWLADGNVVPGIRMVQTSRLSVT